MKRWSVLLISCFVLLGLPATAGADVILPNGDVYRATGDGVYHWIPDVATANALGVDWNALDPVDELPGPAGDPLPAKTAPGTTNLEAAATATRVDAVILPNGDVYQVEPDGTCRWIPDVATANAVGVDWNALQFADEAPC